MVKEGSSRTRYPKTTVELIWRGIPRGNNPLGIALTRGVEASSRPSIFYGVFDLMMKY